MSLTEKIKKFLLENPHLLRSKYAETAEMFNTNYEVIRGTARRLRRELGDTQNQKEKEVINIEEQEDNLKVYVENSNRVKSIDDLIKHCKIDLNEWEINKYDIGTYEVTGFDKDNNPTTVTMYRMKAWLTRIKPELNLKIVKKQLKEDLSDLSPNVKRKQRDRKDKKDKYLLEISAFDLHLGKIGIKGDEYSLEIAEARMFDAIDHLLYRAQGYYIDKILFIAGHDFLNSDGDWPIPATTKGTPQFNSNYHIDIYRAGRKLLIKAINYLSEISDVHVMVVPGNHDRESMMHLGDTLELYYENNENVKVDNNDCLMKMIVYGKNMVISDHGDGPKANDLPGIISQRYKNAWSDVDYVEVHRGHLHTNSKGYIGNIKKAQAFLYHRKNGLQGILNYNVELN